MARTKQTTPGTRCVLGDGAMGTELLRHGISPTSCLEATNVERPALVRSIHRAYRDAEAELLITNTFGANRFRLARHGQADRVDQFNRAAAGLARSVAGPVPVAGSIGPSGQQTHRPPADELRAAFRRQASALVAGGVDLFLCETFGDVEELRAAVLGVRDVSPLPVLASMTYGEDGRTPLGLEPEAVVEALQDLDVTALGVNCCLSGSTLEQVISVLTRSTSLPLVVRPNAGQPARVGAGLQYPLGPNEFAKLVLRLSSRVRMVGGCCGTTPAHIAAAREALRGAARA